MRVKQIIVSFAVAAGISSGAFGASLLLNGSFENGNANNTGQYSFDGQGADVVNTNDSTTIVDWTVFSNDVAVISGNSFGLSPEQGSISLDETSYSDPGPYGGVEQSISTVVNATYELTFWVGAFAPGTTTVQGSAAGFTVLGSSVSGGGPGTTWTEATLDFKANSTTTNVQLLGISPSDNGNYIGLDDASVVLLKLPTVPTPGAVYGGLTLTGLLGLSRLARKPRSV